MSLTGLNQIRAAQAGEHLAKQQGYFQEAIRIGLGLLDAAAMNAHDQRHQEGGCLERRFVAVSPVVINQCQRLFGHMAHLVKRPFDDFCVIWRLSDVWHQRLFDDRFQLDFRRKNRVQMLGR